ncbi:glycogen debranching protein GlgX [Mesorhizobium sp. ZC-5]|nr:glycogen debranching protein GlgX [Mesorhizobium sp. ZC-5]MCV3243650.1 glycogen debranching protein GlgX [Mesorhizobium sp. ZC-5]
MRSERPRFGATVTHNGVRFSVWSGSATRIWLSLFDASGDRETDRLELETTDKGMHSLVVPGLSARARYGFRADGDYDPARGLWFDPDKLLVDPYATAIDRPYLYDPRLVARRGEGGDTAPLMPKAIVQAPLDSVAANEPVFKPGGLIYELNVRAFTKLHPEIPQAQRGTVAALAHPAIIAHLQKLGASAIELMPVTAWIDERHLPPLGLSNAWGYNPVTFMALDPRLAPGGLTELRDAVATLRSAGIGVILDLVFNHTGESDWFGPTLSLRGLDNLAYYRHAPDGSLVNDTGTGNTIATQRPVMREMILDTLRHFVQNAGVDGFRFDLATVLGRGDSGFSPDAPLLCEIRADPLLADRVLIAEPWDIGPDGYQLGNFGKPFLEWNDRYRDDIRRFWRGDRGMAGALATRFAGSSDVFGNNAGETRTVNFIAAHDGMTLADTVAYERKHNDANGEENRDGHNENLSWNNGVEGETSDPNVGEARRGDLKAQLATLFASRGSIMLTAGDEFGRTQKGNNNAYAQDNEITWLDWTNPDLGLEQHVYALAALRKSMPALTNIAFLTGKPAASGEIPDVEWLSETGVPLTEAEWNDPNRHRLTMQLATTEGRIAVLVNGDRRATVFSLSQRNGYVWVLVVPDEGGAELLAGESAWRVPGRTVAFLAERKAAAGVD